MKHGNKNGLFIIIIMLVLMLFVNARTISDVVEQIEANNIEKIGIIANDNTLGIGKKEISINVSNNIGITEKQRETIKNVIKNDFLINDDTIGGRLDQYDPIVSMNNTGNFVIVWMDYRNGNYDIYSQRYDNTGTAVGVNFRVNDDAEIAYQYSPSVSMDSVGNFVIVWEDKRNGNWDIFGQQYDSAGTVVGINFMINSDVGTAEQYSPSVSMDNAGNFIIAWHDFRNSNWDVYSQKYDNAGAVVGINFIVNHDIGTTDQYRPIVSMNSSGNFIITWVDSRNGNTDIYSQQYDSTGMAVGINFMINDDLGTTDQYSPSVSMNNTGNFIIVWMDERNGNYDIYGQQYDSAGTIIGTNFIVNDNVGTTNQYLPSVSMDNEGDFVIIWEDERNGNCDIFGQQYDSTGTIIGTNFIVNDDADTKDQCLPSLSIDNVGNYVIVWYDYRNSNWDIYSQRYDNTGTTTGTNFIVNDNVGTTDQYSPSVSINNAGNFIIAWMDERNGNWDVYSQRYDNTGTAVETNFIVNDNIITSNQRNPSVSMDNMGNCVIIWEDNRNGNSDIYGQQYDSTGTIIGTNFIVNDDIGTTDQDLPSVSMDSVGNFVIVWEDNRDGNYDIYCQRYNYSGTVVGSNFIVNDDAARQYTPSVSINNAGNFVITWQDQRNSNADIYSQSYDNTGAAVGTNFMVNDDLGTADQYSPSVSIDPDSNRFIIYWTDYRNIDGDPEIMTQKYINDIPIDSNMQVNVDSLPYYHQKSAKFGLSCNNNTIVFAWGDDRRGKGWDIYGKLTDWYINSGINDYKPFPKKQEKIGINVYPNPFYNSIMITGGTGEYSIYDISGRLINKINNGIWNGKDKNGKEIINGIYYIKSNDCRSMKIIKMK